MAEKLLKYMMQPAPLLDLERKLIDVILAFYLLDLISHLGCLSAGAVHSFGEESS